MNSPQSAVAHSAYRASQKLDLSPASVLAAVHEELYRTVQAANSAYERRALDQMCRELEGAAKILHGLRAALDFSAAGEDGRRLDAHYLRILLLLNRCLHFSDVSGVLQSVMDDIRSMSVIFRRWNESNGN